jgi:hypothetical protein
MFGRSLNRAVGRALGFGCQSRRLAWSQRAGQRDTRTAIHACAGQPAVPVARAEPAAWPGDRFGTRLMRVRLERGWSLPQLACATRISH